MEALLGISLRKCIIFAKKILLLAIVPADQSSSESVVVAIYNMTAPAGTDTTLLCRSRRMIWTQDRLNDRQRVVHWDLYHATGNMIERVFDMFSAGDQRIYNSYNQRRMFMAQNAFSEGNFSLVIKDVSLTDRGIYSCNLHHHYCHLYESIQVQLNVTKSVKKAKISWDGEKVVIVALSGSTVVLPCVNRNQVWTERYNEEDQQVVHWDRQPPGVSHDRADRLIDLYASGEQRSYGPLFVQKKMNIMASAFADGDFSLQISDLERADEGTYSCHLHHHYCGLHERRIFKLTVMQQVIQTTNKDTNSNKTDPVSDPQRVVEVPKVINVIIPENRTHFFHQLGYILATLLLLVVLITIIALITRRFRKRGFEYSVKKPEVGQEHLNEYVVDTTDLKTCKYEDIPLDYKNNILKEKAELSRTLPAKKIDLDKEFEKEYWK
uniref:Matrix remodeling-associated protein 8 n=1 Tax=Latimeria chalumnae TaxID=7897 RepID=H3BHW3_LATCH